MQPVSFELPECSEKTLRFNCKSIRPGRFSVVGYVIILYGLTYKIYFSELKKFQREVKIKQSHQVEVRNYHEKSHASQQDMKLPSPDWRIPQQFFNLLETRMTVSLSCHCLNMFLR